MPTTYIFSSDHYSSVLTRASQVKQSLYIGTADIKDLYVEKGKLAVPFLKIIAELLKHGVDIKLLHAKEPGPAFCKDFDRYPTLAEKLQRRLCPRIHFKLIIFDEQLVYVGSANLTGAGMGMKGKNTRNFEAGILTDDLNLLDAAIAQFLSVWNGEHCKSCLRKSYCGDPIK